MVKENTEEAAGLGDIFQGENQLNSTRSSSDYHGQFMILRQAKTVVSRKVVTASVV